VKVEIQEYLTKFLISYEKKFPALLLSELRAKPLKKIIRRITYYYYMELWLWNGYRKRILGVMPTLYRRYDFISALRLRAMNAQLFHLRLQRRSLEP
jgi:hypothetical protein